MNFSSYIKAQVSFGFLGDKVTDLFFGEVGAVLLMRCISKKGGSIQCPIGTDGLIQDSHGLAGPDSALHGLICTYLYDVFISFSQYNTM